MFAGAPGDSLYFLLVIGLSLGSLYLAAGQRSRFLREHRAGRYLVATSSLVAVWSLVMAAALFALLSGVGLEVMMPPLERLGQMATLLVLAWALLSGERLRVGWVSNGLLVIGIVLVIALFVHSMREWGVVFEAGGGFNGSGMALVWSGLAVGIGLLGAVAAIVRFNAVVDAPLKCLLFGLVVVGNGWDALLLADSGAEGNYLGGARLAYLGALALVPILIYRLTVGLLEGKAAEAVEEGGGESLGQGEEGAAVDDGRMMEALEMMLESGEGSAIHGGIAGAAMRVLGAEGCLLLRVADGSRAEAVAGVGRLSGGSLSWIPLELNAYASLREAIGRGSQIALERGSRGEELDNLARGLGMEGAAQVVIQPIARGEDVLGLLVASVFDMGEFREDGGEKLRLIGRVAGYVFAGGEDAGIEGAVGAGAEELLQGRSEAAGRGDDVREGLQVELSRLQEEHEELVDSREEMRRDYQALLGRYEAQGKRQGDLEAEVGAMRRRVDEGEAEQAELRGRVAELSEERDNLLLLRDQLKGKIAESLAGAGADEEALRAEGSEADAVGDEGDDAVGAGADGEDGGGGLDGVVGIIRDMQGPMAAIAECADILLGESVGLLGAAQRAALERAAENLESLAEMLDGLLVAASAGVDRFALVYSEVDVVALLDEAILVNGPMMRAKKLALEVEIAEGLPRVVADADCIKGIVAQLLENACRVSADGERVLVKAGMGGADGEAVHISVCDQGGGISAYDIARVFARRYRSVNPKIAGFSGAGVGMAVARAYVRAHGGELWVDSLPGAGSVFQLALPVRMKLTDGE